MRAPGSQVANPRGQTASGIQRIHHQVVADFNADIVHVQFVADTARFLAELRGVEVSQLHETTAANFFQLFGKARP